ncbi:MAG: ATP-binding protein, partial [Leeuwenhoekiella sp.]
FNTIEKGHKIFRRNDDKSKSLNVLGNKSNHRLAGIYRKESNKTKKIENKDFAEIALLEDFVPVAIVINEYLDLVKVFGKTGKYLEYTSGKASRNILKLAKGRLGFEIRRLVKKYNPDEDRILTKAGILLDSNGKKYRVSLHLRQLQEMSSAHYLVVFEEEEIELSPTSETEKSEEDSRIVLLEEEIMELRQELLDKVEEHQISEEELQSANEELMSGTEELQTLNEELETSKEELQSTVEEITVVNQELSTINGLLHREKNISESIIRTIRDPLLILNRNFEVIIANRSFYKNFKVDEVNTLGKSIYQLGNGQWDIPKLHTALESILPKKKVFSDYEVTHNFESIGKKTMVLNGQILKEDGSDEESIFLSIEDVTAERDALSKLKESINTHNEFVRSSPWPIAILKQEDLKVEIANKAMLKVWDKNKDILGKPLAEVVPELASTDIMVWLKEVYRTGVALESFQQKNRLKSSDGKPKYYDVIYQPQRSTDGEVIGVSIIATVVTQQVLLNEKVKESEKQYKELTNNLPEFIISYDIRKEKYYYNKSLLDFTGSSLESLARNNWYSILHPEDYERMMNIYGSAIENNENFEMEVRIRNKEGDYLWCLNRNHCIVDSNGNALRWIGTNTLIQRLKDEVKRKEDFLKLVSHELKTPVTSIKGYVQMILSMISEDPAKPINTLPIKSSLERVENQVTRLTHLIAEMLDLSRMKESKLDLKLESFDLCELVKETILDVQHSSGMVEIKSSFEDVCNVHADKDRIGQVLINFITNAIKYSPEQKDIHVSVYNDEPGYISVSVSDSGIGISDSDLSKIFDRFYRVSGKNEGTYAGFGIGLFLAKAIIDRHNGKIRVESKLNKGSNFIFSLPYEK